MTLRRALIVPALAVEAKAILSFFDDVEVKSAPNGVSYVTGKRKIFSTKLGGKIKEQWSLFVATPTGGGNVEVTRVVHQMIAECDPHLVALIGCAGGFPKKTERFDVVVAPRIDYIARAKVNSRTQIRPHQEVCSSVFIDHCMNVQLLDLWHQYLMPDVANAPINVHFEPIVSGETVLANSRSQFFKAAQASSPRAVAIEMEGYGFLAACREYKVEAAVLRGISDTLDDKNEGAGETASRGMDLFQFKATRHAAALFFATLDFVNDNAFRKSPGRGRAAVTEVSMLLDADMHDVPEIQADLFELFKKYGIRNFSFKPANSIRVGFVASLDAMRIYEALIEAGIVSRFGGFRVLGFSVNTGSAEDRQLAEIVKRIDGLRGASAEEVLRVMRMEGWTDAFPAHAAIIVDALEHQRAQDGKVSRQTGRILYPSSAPGSEMAQLAEYFGAKTLPAVVVTDRRALTLRLQRPPPPPPRSKLLTWFMGHSVLDREIGLDALLAHSKRRLFYTWPGLGAIYAACNIPANVFIDGCVDEWQMMRRASGPSILQILDLDSWDRIGRGQIRDALAGRPATLAKSFDILSLTCRILAQNDLPVGGCIVPSLYVLTFNGVIAGDGAVERMLLTGMAGDLAEVAPETDLPLLAVQSAVRGDTLPYQAAAELASSLNRGILRNTRLQVASALVEPDDASKRRREAVTLGEAATQRYVTP